MAYPTANLSIGVSEFGAVGSKSSTDLLKYVAGVVGGVLKTASEKVGVELEVGAGVGVLELAMGLLAAMAARIC